MNKKKIILIIFLYFFTLSSSFSIEADVFVQSTVNRASKILSENLSKDEKIEKLKIIAEETVDIKGIGFYTLGSIRKNLDGDQKKKYSRLFKEYFLKSFSSRLSEYTNPEIDVGFVVFSMSVTPYGVLGLLATFLAGASFSLGPVLFSRFA